MKNIKIGDKVWVHQIDGTNTDGWVYGILIKKTKKRFLVKNKLRNITQYYKHIKHFDTPSEELEDHGYWKRVKNVRYPSIDFQADNKIQVSAGKSTNNNPESKTRGENDE